MKVTSLYVVILLALVAAASCSEDSVSANYSNSYTVSWSSLGWKAAMYMFLNDWIRSEQAVTGELVADGNGSIDITITGCPAGHTWNIYHSDPTDLHLEGIDSISTDGYTYDISWRCTAHEPGKGYIGFLEVPAAHYAITDATSDLRVAVRGRTNAYRLLIETYGDGEIGFSEILLDSDGSFSREIWLAFIYKGDKFLKADTRFFVIGTVGMPKVIHQKNPLGGSSSTRLMP